MLKQLRSIILTTRYTLFAIFMIGCAGMQRSCASCNAENYGADWIVVTNGTDGKIINCWKLNNVSIANEEHSDGIYWQTTDHHLVHISGWYNRVQVYGGNFAAAAKTVDVDLARCPGGRYLNETAQVGTTIPPAPQEQREDKFGDGRIVNAAFDGGHKVRAVFGPRGVRELWVDGKPTSPTSETGRAALRAVGAEQ